ncbi:NudC domain-containing protein 3-like [Elysia marginata]|uniref:NudC domain-containing protein 3-like n=1 Tax=Elysia marginata TaxID=1093978 RepID=A0AAV4H8C0_9GAST|nr:NudC domain-containing protein 3-like [Elysia marginata]
MAAADEKYDSALLGILQNEGQVAPFLDAVIGFLYRRTDFFRIMKNDMDKMGFPPGVALKLLTNIFKKYESLAAQDEERRGENKQKSAEVNKGQESTKKTKSKTDSESVKTLKTEVNNATPEDSAVTSQDSTDERGLEDSTQSSVSAIEKPRTGQQSVAHGMEVGNQDTESSSSKNENAGEEEGEEDKEDPEQARLRRELQANPLTYNGADCGNYLWSQSIAETDIRVRVPQSIVKGKQVQVDIRKKKLSVSCQEGSGFSELISGELEWEVKAEDSMWTLSPGEFVHINLEKKQERWWERVFVGESGINTRKIDCSRPMTDLDDEAQAKIEEMMFNQRQKQLGLPQSHEVKTHEMLRKAWDAEGSPFKGQPFDPSKFTVDPSGTATFNPGDS